MSRERRREVAGNVGESLMTDPDWYGPPRALDFARLPDDIVNYFSDGRHRDFNLRHRIGDYYTGSWWDAPWREDLYNPPSRQYRGQPYVSRTGPIFRRWRPEYPIQQYATAEFEARRDDTMRRRNNVIVTTLGLGLGALWTGLKWGPISTDEKTRTPDTAKTQKTASAAPYYLARPT